MKHTKLGRLFEYMKRRCNSQKCKDFKNYGGRGIRVCWDSFEDFKNWALANGYAPGLEIDRIDNNGNYEPGNCRFVSHSVNNRNKRMRRDNTTGFTGVWFHNQSGCFAYDVEINKERFRKAGFKTAQDAYNAKMDLINEMNVEYANG